MAEEYRIMVVDDTVTYRKIMSEVVLGIKGATLTATAPNGKLALKKLEVDKPDVVLCDVEMPEMDGLETLKHINEKYPEIGVIMVSGASKRSANLTIECLNAGALDFVPKPEGMGLSESMEFLREKITPLLTLYSTKKMARRARGKAPVNVRSNKVVERPMAAAPKRAVAQVPLPKRFDLLAIGVSTGGPEALTKVIPGLPKSLNVPVVLVQHMPPVFTGSLARNLDKRSEVNVKEAEEGEVLQKGTVYIAPGGFHMVLRKTEQGSGLMVSLNQNPPVKSCRPSVDVLFRSIASVKPGNTLALVMTGMGDDGNDGIAALKRKGCYCVTQSEDSCVVYGMPRAVDESGLSDASVALGEIAKYVTSKIQSPG